MSKPKEIVIRRTSNGVLITELLPPDFATDIGSATVFDSAQEFIDWCADWWNETDGDRQTHD